MSYNKSITDQNIELIKDNSTIIEKNSKFISNIEDKNNDLNIIVHNNKDKAEEINIKKNDNNVFFTNVNRKICSTTDIFGVKGDKDTRIIW